MQTIRLSHFQLLIQRVLAFFATGVRLGFKGFVARLKPGVDSIFIGFPVGRVSQLSFTLQPEITALQPQQADWKPCYNATTSHVSHVQIPNDTSAVRTGVVGPGLFGGSDS